jgi:hypothetical protein
VSVELGVTGATLLMAGSVAAGRCREPESAGPNVDNEDTQRLRSLVADLGMSHQLLPDKIHQTLGRTPFGRAEAASERSAAASALARPRRPARNGLLAFVCMRQLECNGCVQPFIHTPKEQLL